MTLSGIWEGVLSLRGVKNLPLYLFLSVGIWVMYFLHYYLTFFCFDFTAELGLGCALISFVVANFAVIVPTPNGAGPWHFAIKTMLILYGVADHQALVFVLIVHTVQTMLVMALGVYAWARLMFMSRCEVRGLSEVRGCECTEVRDASNGNSIRTALHIKPRLRILRAFGFKNIDDNYGTKKDF